MKKNLQRCLFGLVCILFAGVSITANAQERRVTGKVTDAESGEDLVGVTVLEVGTSNGAITDFNGEYSLSVSEDARLSFSFVGYVTQEVAVGSQTTINVVLELDVKQLQEIVVTGYAVQDKKDLTSAVGIVSPEDLTAVPTGNVANQLQGRVAGVTVTGSGQPGQTAKVRIRGIGSFGNNSPLYVVDGVPTQDISTLNPNDVESVSVLKDAGAAAIYGSRGSNGVIVISTKKGSSSGVSVNYSMYTGSQNPGKGPQNLLDSQGFADLQWLVNKNDDHIGDPATNDPAVPDDADGNDINDGETHPYLGNTWDPTPTLPSWDGNTNWFDAVTRTAPITNHDLSLSGGNESAKFLVGLNYFKQEGIIMTTNSKRFSARINSEYKIKDRVTIGENLQITHRSGVGNFTNLSEANAISDIYRTNPLVPVVMTQAVAGSSADFVPGDWGGTGIAARLGNAQNTVADLTRNKDDLNFDIRVLGSTYLDVKIADGINVRSTFGGTMQNRYFSDYNFATYENSENVATASLTEGASFYNDWIWTNMVTLNKDFGDHSINAVAGYEAVKQGIGRSVSGTRSGYFSDDISYRTLNTGAKITNASSFLNTPRTLVSQFVRADYAFADKYLLSASVRRDGSSVFNEKFAVFPSISAGWRLSDEAFLQGVDFITELKVRGGYGVLGNQLNIQPVNAYYTFGGDAGSSNYDLNGTSTSSLQGFRPLTVANPDAQWESNITSNFGFDAGLLDNKLELIFDLYSKRTVDLLYNQQLPATTAGNASPPYYNIAEMLNTGMDIQAIYRQNISTDLSFEANLTFTTYNNQIVAISDLTDYFDAGGSRIETFARNQTGHASSSFFGYQVEGLWQTQAEVDAADAADGDATSAFQDGAEPGFFRYADINGDGVITPDDRGFIGNPNPDFTYGLNLSVNYKNFDITAFFYGSEGNDIYNYTKWWTDFWQSFQGQKSTDLLSNSWTPENPGATTPKASNNANFSNNQTSNTYYIEDGSYLRLKNLQVGYNLPTNIINTAGLSSARVYLQGVNLLTKTKYSGLDPELGGNDTAFGIDYGNYPVVKQVLVGINLGF